MVWIQRRKTGFHAVGIIARYLPFQLGTDTTYRNCRRVLLSLFRPEHSWRIKGLMYENTGTTMRRHRLLGMVLGKYKERRKKRRGKTRKENEEG
jgi:hypothetical protein